MQTWQEPNYRPSHPLPTSELESARILERL
jgi:hypothetical protein